MHPDPSKRWHLEGFIERLDIWIEHEEPPDDLRLLVTAWVMTRYDDPYQGVSRQPGFENLWFGPIPRSVHDARVVVCAYWIEERRHAVRCDSIATLNLPL